MIEHLYSPAVPLTAADIDQMLVYRLDSGIAALAQHIGDLRRQRGQYTPQAELEDLVWSVLGGDIGAMRALVAVL